VAIAFAFAAFLFGVDFGHANALALIVTVVLTSITMTGFGLLIGGFSFYFRNPIVFANIFTFILLIFCGINFPVQALPAQIQPVSYVFPLTYGVTAARNAIAGASLLDVSPILGQQLAVGLASVMLGYLLFQEFERSARRTGKIEAI
jgi:ABC-2 type transport system permease protein